MIPPGLLGLPPQILDIIRKLTIVASVREKWARVQDLDSLERMAIYSATGVRTPDTVREWLNTHSLDQIYYAYILYENYKAEAAARAAAQPPAPPPTGIPVGTDIFNNIVADALGRELAGRMPPVIERIVNITMSLIGGGIVASGIFAPAGAAGATGVAGAAGAANTAADTVASTAIAGAITSLSAALPMALTGAITTGLTSIFTAVAANVILTQFDVGGWVLNSLLSPIIGGLEALAPTSPVLARQGSNDMMRIASGAMSSLVGMTITAESLSTFKHFGLGYISAMLFDASGYRTLIGAIVGAHVEHAIKIPLSYYTHEKYRPNVLDPRQAAQAWIRGHINLEAYHQHLAWAGYPDIYYPYFEDVAYNPMSTRLMVQLVRSGLYDRELFYRELVDAGYRPATIEKLLAYLQQIANESIVAGSRTLIKKEYKAGVIGKTDYREWLQRTGMSAVVVELEIAVADLEMQEEARDLSVAGILALYREKIIDWDEASRRIAAYGYAEQAIRDLLDLEDARLVTDVKRLTQSQAATALEAGVITRDDYAKILVALNYAEWDASVLLALEDVKLAKKVK